MAVPASERQDVNLASAASTLLWERLDELVQEAPRLSDLVDHRLHLFAARRLRSRGEPVPAEFVRDEQATALLSMMVPHVLARVRETLTGPILLIKGPEVAARYPDPELRPFVDLDLLVPDARAAQQQLLAAGFEEAGEPALYRDIHHLRPLRWPDLPLLVEVHSEPKWPAGSRPPATSELIAVAVPSATGVPGIDTVPPEHHALLLAAHSWAHEPLRRLLELVDVAVTTSIGEREEIERLAERWGIRSIWRTTIAASDSLFGERSAPLALRLWARNLGRVRGRTVLESHLEKWIGSFWSEPPRPAFRRSVRAFADDLAPKAGEGWGQKLRRTALAIANSGRRRAEHDDIVEQRAAGER